MYIDKKNEELLLKYLDNFNHQPCPNCGTDIIKNNGCPNMTCGYCNHKFRWELDGDYKDEQVE